MKTKNDFQSENMKLLMEIFNLKLTLRELYMQKGPASSDYISQSIKLNVLIKEYFEEKTLSLISMSKAELIEIWKQKGFEHLETISASQELDELIFKYQKLQQLGSF
ncbi:Spo0E family sporulation regulatory protein-aspartic acid phosphatase [Cytobacillus sp. FJAT-53684]|uniref:Spo0E family sporulation regulatory protein-aspartic acid phosphatase n=1 Tax=Cytobacillus mangrovibacter TaxID=3299024 RepID=A0ABW6K5T1_9BACI